MTYVAMGLVGMGQLDDDVQESCPGIIFDTEPTNDFCPFRRSYWDNDDVYVMRIVVRGMPEVENTSQALKWAQAYGTSLITIPGYGIEPRDVRGLVFRRSGSGQQWTIDIVVTTIDSGLPVVQRTPAGVIKELNKDKELRKQWPDFEVTHFSSLELLKNTSDWLAAPIVWSSQLFNQIGIGKTEAYGRGEGVWMGGTAANPQAKIQPKPPTPIIPPPGPGPVPPPAGPPSKNAKTAGVLLGVALVGAVGYFAFVKPKQKRKRKT
jgi:hypothetical protein